MSSSLDISGLDEANIKEQQAANTLVALMLLSIFLPSHLGISMILSSQQTPETAVRELPLVLCKVLLVLYATSYKNAVAEVLSNLSQLTVVKCGSVFLEDFSVRLQSFGLGFKVPVDGRTNERPMLMNLWWDGPWNVTYEAHQTSEHQL